MYKIMIERNITIVYNEDNKEVFNAEGVAGILVNDENIIDVVSKMDINRYYINLNGTIMELNKEATIYAYNKILSMKNEKEEPIVKNRRKKN